jgi:hypothetical protein
MGSGLFLFAGKVAEISFREVNATIAPALQSFIGFQSSVKGDSYG